MISHGLQILAQASNGGTAVFAVGSILFFLLLAVASVFWLWMLVDCLTSSKPSTEKLIWVLVIIFTHIVGALLYFFLGRGNRSIV